MSTENKEKIGPGKFVAYSYKVYNTADRSLLFEAPENAPDTLIFGVSQDVVPGVTAAMDGLSAGDKFTVELPPAAGFGERNEENVIELDREIFTRDGDLAEEVKEGAILPMMTADGMRIQGKVLSIGKTIKMDFNHPFAGMTVEFDGKIIDVRDATEDELNPRHGGCGGGCGSCSDGGCGDNCDNSGCGGGCH